MGRRVPVLLWRNCVCRIWFITKCCEDSYLHILLVRFIPWFHSPTTFMVLSALCKHSWAALFQKEVPSVKPRTASLSQLGNCSRSNLPVSGLSYINPPTLQNKVITVSLGSLSPAQYVFALDTCHINQIRWDGKNSHRQTANLCSPTKEIPSTIHPVAYVSLPTSSVLKTSFPEIKNNFELFMSFIWHVKCGLCVLMVEELPRSPSTGPPE